MNKTLSIGILLAALASLAHAAAGDVLPIRTALLRRRLASPCLTGR